MKLHDYKLLYKDYLEHQFDPEDYGYTWEEYEAGKINAFEEWVSANYGNSSTAAYLRENREAIEG